MSNPYMEPASRPGRSPGISRLCGTFIDFCLQEGEIDRDPTERLTPPRQWATLPKYLNRDEVDRSAGRAAARISRPGLRDRAMLELLYATGLRVSELCGLELSAVQRETGVLRVTGKGNKQRMVPFGEAAGEAIDQYLEQRASAAAEGRASRYLFVTARGAAMTRQSFWKLLRELWTEGGITRNADAARDPAQLRHASGGGRSGFAQRADHAGSRRYFHHPGLYARGAAAFARDRRSTSSARVIPLTRAAVGN